MKCSLTTEDRLLGGRVIFAQSREGYRVAIDPILLAASVVTRPADRILDAGCGAGAAALCLAARMPGCSIVGVERQADAARLAKMNIDANGFGERITVVEASFPDYAAATPGHFTQVMMNPPFHEDVKHTPSPDPGKAASHGEDAISLSDWIAAAALALQPAGVLTLIHRADRIGHILTALDRRFGAVLVVPLWPRAGAGAKRVIVSAIKGRKTLPRILPGLVLHMSDGAYSAEADAILRDGQALDLTMSSA